VAPGDQSIIRGDPILFKQRPLRLKGEGEILIFTKISKHDGVGEDGPRRGSSQREKRISSHSRIGEFFALCKEVGFVLCFSVFFAGAMWTNLPQIWNVLEGKMSFVGRGPHAVVTRRVPKKLNQRG